MNSSNTQPMSTRPALQARRTTVTFALRQLLMSAGSSSRALTFSVDSARHPAGGHGAGPWRRPDLTELTVWWMIGNSRVVAASPQGTDIRPCLKRCLGGPARPVPARSRSATRRGEHLLDYRTCGLSSGLAARDTCLSRQNSRHGDLWRLTRSGRSCSDHPVC
jgi:hypothetical protein